MGIRFHCPNGHKLNVKEYLVGKRGICPDCDARFIVPESSGLVAVPVDAADESEPSPAADPIPENQPAAAPPAAPPVVDSSPLPTAAPSEKPEASPSPELELRLTPDKISPRPQKSRSEKRRDRARKLSYALGSVILLLTATLVIVLWFQN